MMSLGPFEITLLGVVATAVIGALGYLIRRGIEEQDVLTVRIDGQPTVHLAVKDDLRALSLGYSPPKPEMLMYDSCAHTPEVKLGHHKLEPSFQPLQAGNETNFVNYYNPYGVGSEKINYTFDANRKWTLDVGPLTITPPQEISALLVPAASIAAYPAGKLTYKLFDDSTMANLQLGNAVAFQGSQALIDSGTIAYGNQSKSIGLLAKYDPSTISKVEIIDNDKEFVFRLEKK